MLDPLNTYNVVRKGKSIKPIRITGKAIEDLLLQIQKLVQIELISHLFPIWKDIEKPKGKT